MHRSLSYIFIAALLLKASISPAQNITGTWEGDLDNSEFLQLNIVQKGNNLCGYTWDYLYKNRKDYCKAYFSGYFDKKSREWIISGTAFIGNSGDHVLMNIRFIRSFEGADEILEGIVTTNESGGLLFSFLNRQKTRLKKVSRKPTSIYGDMSVCLENKEQKPEQKLEPKKDPEKPKPADTIKKIIGPVEKIPTKPIDTLKEIKKPVVPPVILKDSNRITTLMTKRKNTEASHLIVHEKEIRLEVYDNGIIDSDTVSIFYNGKLILSHKLLSEKAIVIPITLDEKITTHEIILFAENLGSIPPNTALVVVHAGNKRYELFASASLTENAVITFEYKPK